MKSSTRAAAPSANDRAQIAAIRHKYRAKPTPDQLLASGDYDDPVTLATRWAMMRAAAHLKSLRESSQLTIRALAEKTGMTPAALSRLENGVFENATVRSLNRYAIAFGQHVEFSFKDAESLAQKAKSVAEPRRGKVEMSSQPGVPRSRNAKAKRRSKGSQPARNGR